MTTLPRALTRAQVQARIDELGPWFHNLNLCGVPTAPNHFLGDYPNIKFKALERALPKDMTGKTVLDIGCKVGFCAMEMACSEAMLRSSGFEIVDHPEEEVFLCRRFDLPPAPDGPRAIYPAKRGSQ